MTKGHPRLHSLPSSSRSRSRSFLPQLFFSLFLCLLLFSDIFGGWASLPSAFAAGRPHPPHAVPIPGSLTFQKFLQESAQYAHSKGHFVRPQHTSPQPRSKHDIFADYTHLPPSAEPPSMKPISQPLDNIFLQGGRALAFTRIACFAAFGVK